MRFLLLFVIFLFLYSVNIVAQNCAAPTNPQAVYIWSYQAQFAVTLQGMGGQAEIVPEGQPFDNPTVMGLAGSVVTFFGLSPGSTYTWRTRTHCQDGGFSDWSPVFTFTTPSACTPPQPMPFDSTITFSFPATLDTSLHFSNCGQPINGNAYIFTYVIPATGDYRISVLESTGGDVRSSVIGSLTDYCRMNLNCWSSSSQAGTYRDFNQIIVGNRIVFVFSAGAGVDATRKIRFTYKPCAALTPNLLSIDTIRPTSARLYVNTMRLDMEFISATDTFTGIPSYSDIPGGFIEVNNLIPATDYRWRARTRCDLNIGPWLEGTVFRTPYPCDEIPFVQCDYVYPGFQTGAGQVKMFRYRPEVSHLMQVTWNFPEDPELTVALRDSALADCFGLYVQDWPVKYCCGSGTDTFSLGYVEAGKTYYLYANKVTSTALPGAIRWECPSFCPAPGNFTVAAVNFHDILLGWHNNEFSNDWEIELRTNTNEFVGNPQFNGSGNNFVVPDLQSNTRYYWRIRNICTQGAGEWSSVQQFRTPETCANAVDVGCNVLTQGNNVNQLSALNTCEDVYDGAERFYRFTPDYSGIFQLQSLNYLVRYLIKPLNGDCESDAGWTCIGTTTDPGTWSLGLLTGGQTYLIAQDFFAYANYGEITGRFRITCPIACVTPTNLTAELESGSVTLSWTEQPNQVSWQIEIKPVGTNFTGVPNYFSTADSLLITDLTTSTRYQARVRGGCGAFGNSGWSAAIQFLTLPDCEAYPLLQCEESINLSFPAGNGYWTNMVVCDLSMSGMERIIRFVPGSSTHYMIVASQGSHGLALKKAGVSACEAVSGWECILNSIDFESKLITLNNLEPGATYYLLCKKIYASSASTLQVTSYCSLPCPEPSNTTMSDITSSSAAIKWNGATGPWKYQVALRFPDGSEQVHSDVEWFYYGSNILSWFNITNNTIHGWRVRTICDSGDTSAWTPYTYFRLPLCVGAEKIPCSDTLVSLPTDQLAYYYKDVCGNTQFGQQRFYRLDAYAGAQSLQFYLDNTLPVRYTRVQAPGGPCSGTWIPCTTLTDGTLLPWNAPVGGVYYIQLSTLDTTTLLAPTIVSTCPCNLPGNGKGVLYSDSTAVLTWGMPSSGDSSYVEIVPAGTAFTGIPNYVVDGPPLLIPGLDPYQVYQFRIRNRCGATGYSNWSDTFGIRLQIDCSMLPPQCGDIFTFELGYGFGSTFDYTICNVPMDGDGTFFRIVPDFPGFYELRITEPPLSNNKLYLAFVDDCAHPGSSLTCIGNGGFVGTYNLGYLEEGQSYMLVAAYQSIVNGEGIYHMQLECSWPNDGPGFPADSPFFLPVDDSCRVFRNRWASGGSFDPDPSTPPGNWRDGPQHTVWFAFTAPPGGTVQISATSEGSEPFDPQVALMSYDTIGGSVFMVLMSGEDNAGPNPADATMTYTGLIPGNTYYIMVDGANGSSGSFCLRISDEPELWLQEDTCQTFVQPALNAADGWINLYAGDNDPHVNGPLLGAIRSVDDLGTITVSTEILPDAPVLPNGQKILPRYFNIETEFQPQHPVTLRLFFTAADLEAFNITPPASVNMPFQLGLTHYDGNDEDCDPTNNALTGGLAVTAAQAMLVGENGIFYLETVFNSFSEFGAALAPTSGVAEVNDPLFAVSVAPNPFARSLQLQVRSSVAAKLDFRIFDLLAIPVHHGQFNVNAGENTEMLDLSSLAPGVYQLVLYEAGTIKGHVRLVKI